MINNVDTDSDTAPAAYLLNQNDYMIEEVYIHVAQIHDTYHQNNRARVDLATQVQYFKQILARSFCWRAVVKS